MSPADDAGQRISLSFRGAHAPPAVLARISYHALGGVTLFRFLNVEDPDQVRHLTAELQTTARTAGQLPLLIAADQEGGQLMALGEWSTPYPGNMALGAAGSPELAHEVGYALGRELAAVGINVDYAPVCDVSSNPLNPVIGVRSFGEDPRQVGELAAAMARGLQAAGVAATAKHFPGHGDATTDSHFGTPALEHQLERLRRVELAPFHAAIAAGVQAVMVAHVALPALTGSQDLPATLARAIVTDLLRHELGFEGVVISDSLDMRAIEQGPAFPIEAIAAANAGTDLLLLGPGTTDAELTESALAQAVRRGLIGASDMQASVGRIARLKQWVSQTEAQPDVSVIGCSDHRALANRVAGRSITLVRDDAHLLPVRLGVDQRISVILPRLTDLTPADTSSYVTHTLGDLVRSYHPRTVAVDVSEDPSTDEIERVVAQLGHDDLVIVATVNAIAQAGQAALVRAALSSGRQTIVAALRLPYDLAAFPSAPTYLCTYSALEPSMRALVNVLFGAAPAEGRLPVSIPGLYPRGRGPTLPPPN